MLKKYLTMKLYPLVKSFKHQKPFFEFLYFYFIGVTGGARRDKMSNTVKAKAKGKLTSNQYIFNKDSIIGIWNFSSRPYSLGDILNFCIELAVEAKRKQLPYTDLYIIIDPLHPAPSNQSHVSSVNYDKFLFEMLPVFNFCPVIRDIHIVRNRQSFEQELLTKNLFKEHCYPSLTQYFYELDNGTPYSSLFSIFNDFKREYGYVPKLKRLSGFSVLNNSIQFGFHPKQIFVAVHLRQRRADTSGSCNDSLHRDAEQDVWLEFFSKAKIKFPQVKFIIIGRIYEFPRELFMMENVIVLKSYGYGIAEELTVIQDADLFMGSNSGPATVAMFSNTPYFIFQDEKSAHVAETLADMKIGQEVPFFAYEEQYFKWKNPTVGMLMSCLSSFYKKAKQKSNRD